jgi:hypothetical protein
MPNMTSWISSGVVVAFVNISITYGKKMGSLVSDWSEENAKKGGQKLVVLFPSLQEALRWFHC